MSKKEKDPLEETVMCQMYDTTTKKTYPQMWKRYKLVGRRIIFETTSKEKCVGVIKGFFEKDGEGEEGVLSMMVFNHKGKIPDPKADIMVIKGKFATDE